LIHSCFIPKENTIYFVKILRKRSCLMAAFVFFMRVTGGTKELTPTGSNP
jgi:hypothetical protein